MTVLNFPKKNNDRHVEFDVMGDKVILEVRPDDLITAERAITMLERAKFQILTAIEGIK